ncbi:hypothetical protein [Haemophilus influenzae]|uniref:Uncharacterized protein n=1 Tax=Haemophilus influenzae TaxID=727 RepID=Q9L8P0_HAEIF|nr:hypothetical protein [Haemophilus influenzae]CVP30157.1 Uncharacterised protein [Streptococcus pneumoniae]AAF27350.1 unknown [Haemophilus influenzae]MBK1414323.1 hypothetical protein [Haemophilus influenzae]MCK8897437.1 hypothetical protein [Haemophilus influenzae]MCK8933591.1 hypothetical protein [Haemophilus influenzae]
MKPSNPMQQLQQWKKNNEQRKINQFVNEMNRTKNLASDSGVSGNGVHPNKLKIELVKNCESAKQIVKVQNVNLHSEQNTQGNARSEAKSKYQGKLYANPLAFKFAQLTRQFKLILDSNRKCLEVYPDDFHHKLKMRDEMMDLIDRLKAGGKLFNALAKSQGGTFCRDNQATLKDFNQANGYLIHKFGEVVAQIERLNIERVEGEKLQGASNE